MKENGPFQIAATLAAIILWTFIIFCAALWTSQTDTFQRVLKDFDSGVAQAELLPYAKDSFDKQLTVWKDIPNALQGGALLIGSQFHLNPALMLVDGDGKILHSWDLEKQLFNRDILSWWKEPLSLDVFAVDDAHLLPDGDVIFTQDLRDLQNFRGQRLARMDWNSHILWQATGAFHHEFDIGGSPRKIYAMLSEMRAELPFIGPKLKNVHYLDDVICAYSLQGKKLDSWPISEAFVNSSYRNLYASFEIDLPDIQRIKSPDGKQVLYDPVHLNSVQYLDAVHAKAIPLAQEGDLLISLRGINTLAVLRPSSRKIIWASTGPWRHQHYARVGDDGKLYVYDNEGAGVHFTETANRELKEELQSRVLRYDPLNANWDEIYSSPRLHSYWRGYYYALSGGYTIISSPQQSRVIVVTRDKKVVWELRGVPDRDMQVVPYQKQISTVRYYPPDALAFLKQQGNKP